jgi:hypothetical protein
VRDIVRHTIRALLLAAGCLGAVTGFAQSVSPSGAGKPAQAATPKPDSKLAQLDQGAISGNIYRNKALRFSTEFPAEWKIVDVADQSRIIEANHTATFGDSEAAEREHEMVWRCTRILLWTKKAETDLLLITAVDPGCFPKIRFPASGDDREGIQKFIESQRPPRGQGEDIPDEKVTTFVLQGHLMLDVSLADTADESPVYTSFVMTPVKGYWLTLIFAAPSQAALEELKKKAFSSVKFDVR